MSNHEKQGTKLQCYSPDGKQRQLAIEENLSCKIVRVKENDDVAKSVKKIRLALMDKGFQVTCM